jgi:hypothetical protein
MGKKKTSAAAPPAEEPAPIEPFLAKFDPAVAAVARAALERLRELAPGAIELVYDAYNALSISFGSSEKLGDAFTGVVVYPKHVNLAFHRGAELDDPAGLLQGTGARIRHVRATKAVLEDPRFARLVRLAAERAGFERGGMGRVVVKAVYARQRPRKPSK